MTSEEEGGIAVNGAVSLEGTQSDTGLGNNGASTDDALKDEGSKTSTAAANTSDSAEYISNLTQMMIDS